MANGAGIILSLWLGRANTEALSKVGVFIPALPGCWFSIPCRVPLVYQPASGPSVAKATTQKFAKKSPRTGSCSGGGVGEGENQVLGSAAFSASSDFSVSSGSTAGSSGRRPYSSIASCSFWASSGVKAPGRARQHQLPPKVAGVFILASCPKAQHILGLHHGQIRHAGPDAAHHAQFIPSSLVRFRYWMARSISSGRAVPNQPSTGSLSWVPV